MRLKGLLLITVAVVVTSLSMAASASASAGMQLGVEDDTAFLGGSANANRAIQAADQLRASAIRVFVMWADVRGANAFSRRAPKHPRYNFHAFDGAVTRALQRHMQVQMVLTGPAPAWATANHRKGTFAPRSPYFGEFARQAAAYFKGRVKRFSVWNEPNYVAWLGPASSAPSIYRALYNAAYSSIKRVDHSDQVWIGETSPYYESRRAIAPLNFLRQVLCNGRCRLRTDGYAHHPYDFYHSPTYHYPGGDNVTIGTLSRLSNALSSWARRGALRTPQGHTPPIFLTEFGYLSSGGARISDSRHAAYLKQSFDIALRARGVRQLLQYTLIPPRGRYAFFDMSILTSRWVHRQPFRVLSGWARGMEKRHLLAAP